MIIKFLCIALIGAAFAQVAQASENAMLQSTTLEDISEIIREVHYKQYVTTNGCYKVFTNLFDPLKQYRLDAETKIISMRYKVVTEINQLTSNATGVNITECLKHQDNLIASSKSLIKKMKECFIEKYEMARDQYERIEALFDVRLAELYKIKEEARMCGKNVSDNNSARVASSCILGEKRKANPIVPKLREELKPMIAALKASSKCFDKLLATCATLYDTSSFLEETLTIVEKTKKCIKQKTDESQNTDT